MNTWLKRSSQSAGLLSDSITYLCHTVVASDHSRWVEGMVPIPSYLCLIKAVCFANLYCHRAFIPCSVRMHHEHIMKSECSGGAWTTGQGEESLCQPFVHHCRAMQDWWKEYAAFEEIAAHIFTWHDSDAMKSTQKDTDLSSEPTSQVPVDLPSLRTFIAQKDEEISIEISLSWNILFCRCSSCTVFPSLPSLSYPFLGPSLLLEFGSPLEKQSWYTFLTPRMGIAMDFFLRGTFVASLTCPPTWIPCKQTNDNARSPLWTQLDSHFGAHEVWLLVPFGVSADALISAAVLSMQDLPIGKWPITRRWSHIHSSSHVAWNACV